MMFSGAASTASRGRLETSAGREDSLSIGINALYLIPGRVGGTEIYLRCLLQALSEIDRLNRYTIYTNLETGSLILPPGAPNFTIAVQAFAAKSRPVRLIWEQTELVLAMRRDRIDVVLNPGYTMPYFAPCPSVTVFHDMQHRRHPEFSHPVDLLFFRLFYYAAAHRSNRLIAVSRATKDDMLDCYDLPAQKIRAIPHGVDPRFFELRKPMVAPTPKTILAVSTLHPHKGLDRLLRVFAAWRAARNGEYQLCIAGLEGHYAKRLRQLAADLRLSEVVAITGWISREELYQSFANAAAFIYPSQFEGFGLPILEALAAGLPSACSDIKPLNQIARDSALFFDPNSDQAMADALTRLTEDENLRQRLAAHGLRRAARFPWQRTARATLALLRAAARNPRGDWA